MIKGVVVERRDMLTDCNENGGGGGTGLGQKWKQYRNGEDRQKVETNDSWTEKKE